MVTGPIFSTLNPMVGIGTAGASPSFMKYNKLVFPAPSKPCRIYYYYYHTCVISGIIIIIISTGSHDGWEEVRKTMILNEGMSVKYIYIYIYNRYIYIYIDIYIYHIPGTVTAHRAQSHLGSHRVDIL